MDIFKNLFNRNQDLMWFELKHGSFSVQFSSVRCQTMFTHSKESQDICTYKLFLLGLLILRKIKGKSVDNKSEEGLNGGVRANNDDTIISN